MTERFWSNGSPTEYGVDFFMYGECWALAYYLNRIGGWPVCMIIPINDPENMWDHVAVEINDRLFDVRGFSDVPEGMEARAVDKPWRSLAGYVRAIGQDDTVPETLGVHGPSIEVVCRYARTMAHRLVEKYRLAS